MALNDYADRDLDKTERPERPIPSGRVTPAEALTLAGGLTGASLCVAAAGGGRRALRVAVPLAATVWTYDLLAKQTAAGPACMAAARGLDVLLGAGGRFREAALPSLAVTVHTAAVTGLSRGEVHGGSERAGQAAMAGTAAAAAAAAIPHRPAGRLSALAGAALAAGYGAVVGRSQFEASRRPDAATVRRATGTGVRGVILLQSALAARSGALGLAAGLLGAGPIARMASKVVSPT
jgi:4-hydroxybenzoate polyprenyltransferase